MQEALSSFHANAELGATVNNGFTPLWMAANQYGLTGIKGSNADLRVGIFHDADSYDEEANAERGAQAAADTKRRNWRIGYGLDAVLEFAPEAEFFIHQAYADINYRRLLLSIGAKERGLELKNDELSSGAQTLGINARPMPAVRIEVPDYWPLSPAIALRGHFSYGWMTDGKWQRDYVAPGIHYARHALLHTKALFLRLGNEARFPLTFEGGLEMACQFGGHIHNPIGSEKKLIRMPHGVKDYFMAIYGGGSDETDGDYLNAQGNTTGSWLASLAYKGEGWRLRAYYDHFFEDHSQAFLQYGWRDGLIGIEATLPQNRFVTTVVYEHLRTTHQSGPIYHDRTADMPIQISAADNYYNHNLYQGWQHYGMAIGNPLFTSPLYNDNGDLQFVGNRFTAHHLAFCGDPTPALHYRFLYSHIRNWGTYNIPFPEVRHDNSFLLEATYQGTIRRFGGYSLKAAVGADFGNLIGNNFGLQISVSKPF
ncbi:MAG: hypothetical protein IJ722_07665 [Alloprevotella sp.]|nr:hypothetical protein [Alloprevotella sp.]